MNLIPWQRDPFNGGLTRLRDEMDRMLTDFSIPLMAAETPARAATFFPPIDVSETDAELMVKLEAPGIPAKDLDISISGTTLSISGQKEEKEEKKDQNYYRSERRFGAFRRVIELPDTIDAERINAESDNGVVTVRISKKPGARTRQVEIKPVAKKVPVGT